ncbi:hypothetical protein MHL31_02720 [Lutibacter sp. A80]|uniref:DUF7935 family protein n=1 Tax=Lutibacter sp. A80 TaxID=2918453 RepID=UPI001F061410|nr:hypothetical protein [Lutibacter sp. A80]UMB61125.1 hypothetical protein MHL31_02720 [Lutibacter sp. A80]
MEKFIELLTYTIPAIVTGAVAYYFFMNHTDFEQQRLKLSLLKENQKAALPIKLQAYERMTLYLERINPSKLLLRITSINNDKEAYVLSLINTIEQEFEHNLSQQIYISEKCWSIIITSKNATIQLIKQTELNEDVKTAQDLREAVLKKMLENTPPSTTALAFIKDEVKSII